MTATLTLTLVSAAAAAPGNRFRIPSNSIVGFEWAADRSRSTVPRTLMIARQMGYAANRPGTPRLGWADWDMRQPPEIDEYDWWYRTEFATPTGGLDQPCWLNEGSWRHWPKSG